jgi:hypothetical protein
VTDEYQEEKPRRGILWWIFCMPGAVMMWFEYMFPKGGDVYASARRRGNRLIQFYYTLVFYLFVAFIIFIFIVGASEM